MVFGYGRMGKATVAFLKKFGFHVIAVDKEYHPSTYYDILIQSDVESHFEYLLNVYGPNLVVSTLPYYRNIELARLALRLGISYIDLGGCVHNTKAIKDLAEENNKVAIFTDLGLAPGLINIRCEHILKSYHPEQIDRILCAVGGIPEHDLDPPFNYLTTWSADGLVNEYADKCVVLNGGRPTLMNSMFGLEHIVSKTLGKKLEMFMTSGASAHSVDRIKELGYYNFVYKTLRYVGHREFVKPLLEYGRENMGSIFSRLSSTAKCQKDIVIGIVRLTDINDDIIIHDEFAVKSNEEFTAMQIATAGPLATIGSMILDGYLPQKYLTYADVVKHYSYFRWKLKTIGIEL